MPKGIHQQGADRVITVAERGLFADRAIQPTPQHAAAHGRHRAIHDPDEAVLLGSEKAGVYFQIAARRGIEDQALFPPFHAELA